MAALTYRERLAELRRELLEHHRDLKPDNAKGAMWLEIAAGAVADALKALPRAALAKRLRGAPSALEERKPPAAAGTYDAEPEPSLKAGLEPACGAAPAASEVGGGSLPAEPAGTPAGPAVSPAPSKVVRLCGICRQAGHRRETCPQATEAAGAAAATPRDEEPVEEPDPAAAPALVHLLGAPEGGTEGLAPCGALGEAVRVTARRALATCPDCLRLTAPPCTRCGKRGHTRTACPLVGEEGVQTLKAYRAAEDERVTAIADAPIEVVAQPAPGPDAEEIFGKDPCSENTNAVHSNETAKQEVDDEPPENEVLARREKVGTIDDSDEVEDFDARLPKVVHLIGRGRGVRHCRRCHQPGHITRNCDVDLTDARLQDIAAACVRLGISAPPEPRSPLPVLPSAPPPRALASWNRADPDEDLTDLELGATEPAPPTAPAADGPTLVSVPPPIDLTAASADPTPAQERLRAKLRVINGRVRAKTISANGAVMGHLSRKERAAADDLLDPSAYDRPRVRGDCESSLENGTRPCPWVSCPHHLALDVNDETGSLKLNFPHLEVWEMAQTCSLDIADRGGITLEEIGAILNLTRERVRQVEVKGLDKIKAHAGDELGLPPEREHSPLGSAMDD